VSEVGNSGRTWVIDIRLLYFNGLNKRMCLKGNIYERMRMRKLLLLANLALWKWELPRLVD
jgi:hypothetical protein